jgi:Icc-related predicted phosphoesterase
MKYAWLTDIHLNFLKYNERISFYEKIKSSDADVVFITGDIGEAPSFMFFLEEMFNVCKKRIYYVLGNHDYYNGSIEVIRHDLKFNLDSEPSINYMGFTGTPIVPGVMLVGSDCWADGRNGSFAKSPLVLNDSKYIEELCDAKFLDFDNEFKGKKNNLLASMQKYADAGAQHLETIMSTILTSKIKKIIILMHVPPFPENSQYRGKQSDDNYLPYYSSKVVGDMLLKLAKGHPHVEFLGLCGHSHGKSFYQPLPNLTVKGGEAEYKHPIIQEIETV